MRAGLAAMAVVWILLLAGPVVAGPAGGRTLGHANLVASQPGSGEVVADSPTQLTLTFGEPIEGRYSNVDVLDGEGTAIVTRAGAPDPSDSRTLIVPLPTLSTGAYTVDWRTVSATDGHSMSGFFTFGVGAVAPPTLGATRGSAGDLHAGHGAGIALLETESRALADLGFMLALGLAVAALVILRSVTITPAVACALGIGAFGSVTLALVGASSSGAPPVEYLLDTRTGLLLLWRIGIAALGALGVLAAWRAGRPRLGLILGALAAFAGICLIALGGHAAGFAAAAPLAAAIVHLCCAGVWLGGLAVVAWAASLPSPERPLREIVPRFSALALIAIALVAATGTYADWLLTGDPLRFDTPYALALLVKILLVVTALALGLANYLDGGRDQPRFGGLGRRVIIEAGLAVAIVIATGNLASGSPPGIAAPVTIAPAFSSASAAEATLALEPGRPGPTRFQATVPGTPLDVVLVLTRTNGGSGNSRAVMRPASGSRAGRTTFVTDGGILPADTSWDATVIVSDASGTETGRTRFVFAIGTEGVVTGRAAPVIDVGLFVALSLLVGAAVLAVFTLAGGALPGTHRRTGRLAAAVGCVLAAVLGLAMLLAGT